MQRITLSLIAATMLVVAVDVRAQSSAVAYTEEFGGGGIANGTIGENGWSVQGTPGASATRDPNEIFVDTSRSGQVGFIKVKAAQGGLLDSNWAGLILGDVTRGITSIPRILPNDTLLAEFTFGVSNDRDQLLRVGLFRPTNDPGTIPGAGCYVEAGARGDGNDPFAGAFKYVCFDNGSTITEVSSGVIPDFANQAFYTLRMRASVNADFKMTITRVGAAFENNLSARTLPSRFALGQELVPGFVAGQGFSFSEPFLLADYFNFRYEKILR